MDGPAPPVPRLVLRACVIGAVLATAVVRLLVLLAARPLVRMAAGFRAGGPMARRRNGPGTPAAPEAVVASVAGSVAADTLQRLGPAFVKAGQLLSTRVDVLPRSACAALARLHDQLPVLPPVAAARAVPPALLAELDACGQVVSDKWCSSTTYHSRRDDLCSRGLVPVGGGSIACVYRARLRDGRTVAVKVRRPGIERTMRLDLALLRAGARALQRLPRLRGAPLVDVVEQVGESIWQQLDLAREAAAMRSLRANLAELDGVRVPAVLDELSTPDVLVMEYVGGLRRGATAPGPAREATLRALRAVYHMLFLDGFVHCDLHPGNLYPMPDGSVVIVDAGFSRRLTETARRGFASFFYHMSRGNAAACADVVLATARRAGPAADPDRFRAGMATLVEPNHGVPVADFDLVGFAVRLFGLQREHGFHADPQFVFQILSLIVLEGTLRGLCPDVDFQTEAIPYVLRGLMR